MLSLAESDAFLVSRKPSFMGGIFRQLPMITGATEVVITAN